LTKLSPPLDFGARMNTSNSEVKRSSDKVTMGSYMPHNSLFGLVVVTCCRRHNSQWSRNYHLVVHCIEWNLRLFKNDRKLEHVCCMLTRPRNVCCVGEMINEKDRCKKCRGKKVTQESKDIEIHVDPGMKDGQKITLHGQGDQMVSAALTVWSCCS